MKVHIWRKQKDHILRLTTLGKLLLVNKALTNYFFESNVKMFQKEFQIYRCQGNVQKKGNVHSLDNPLIPSKSLISPTLHIIDVKSVYSACFYRAFIEFAHIQNI